MYYTQKLYGFTQLNFILEKLSTIPYTTFINNLLQKYFKKHQKKNKFSLKLYGNSTHFSDMQNFCTL